MYVTSFEPETVRKSVQPTNQQPSNSRGRALLTVFVKLLVTHYLTGLYSSGNSNPPR